MNRNVFLSVLGHYKVELDTEHEDYDLNLDAPKGKVFASNGCHCICVPWNNSGGQSWKSEAYEDAIIQVKMGLYDCDDPACDVCHGEEGMTNSEALSCWVKALQTDNLGLPKMSVREAGTDERVEVDLYNDNPTHLVDGTWTEAVVTPRGQDDKS